MRRGRNCNTSAEDGDRREERYKTKASSASDHSAIGGGSSRRLQILRNCPSLRSLSPMKARHTMFYRKLGIMSSKKGRLARIRLKGGGVPISPSPPRRSLTPQPRTRRLTTPHISGVATKTEERNFEALHKNALPETTPSRERALADVSAFIRAKDSGTVQSQEPQRNLPALGSLLQDTHNEASFQRRRRVIRSTRYARQQRIRGKSFTSELKERRETPITISAGMMEGSRSCKSTARNGCYNSRSDASINRARTSLHSITIHVRDHVFEQRLNHLHPNFKWIGNVARMRYAVNSRLRVKPDEYEVTMVTDCTGNALMPNWDIKDHLAQVSGGIWVELQRRHPGIAHFMSDCTIWYLAATVPRKEWVELEITYNEKAFEAVSCYTNLDFFAKPNAMAMRKRGLWAVKVLAPAEARVHFFFKGRGVKTVINKYAKARARFRGRKLKKVNEIVAKKQAKKHKESPWDEYQKRQTYTDPNSSTDQEYASDTGSGGDEEEVDWKFDIPECPQGAHLAALLQKDWRESEYRNFDRPWLSYDSLAVMMQMQLNDVVPQPGDRKEIRKVLEKFWNPLQQIFRAYACRKQPIFVMDQNSFSMMIGNLKLYDKRFTVSHVSQIFLRVNIEEDYGSDEEQVGVDLKNGMLLANDDANPDNAFIRSEFLEALVRVALAKWPRKAPAAAYERLITRSLLVKEQAILDEINGVRNLMNTGGVRRIFAPHLERIFGLVFLPVTMLDEAMKSERGRRGDIASAALSLEELYSFHNAVKLPKRSGLNMREAFKAYAMPIEPRLAGGRGLVKEDAEMRWPQFLAMLVRLALSIPSSTDDYEERIADFLNLLVGPKGIVTRKTRFHRCKMTAM
eukprot:jgi/Bigna1/130890/aug1.12_g5598